MMEQRQFEREQFEQEQAVMRWGGLAGLLGSLLFILAMIVVMVGPVGMDEPADLTEWVTSFPAIKGARIVENLVYLMALMLQVPLFLAVYRSLRRTSLAPALFGSVLGILGLAAMMVSSIPHAAHTALYDTTLDAGMAQVDPATVALVWQAIWGMVDVTTYVGFFVVSTSLVVLAVGMIGSAHFGKLIGGAILVFGGLGLVGAVLQIIDPASMIGVVSYFAGIISYFILGWKLINLSRATEE